MLEFSSELQVLLTEPQSSPDWNEKGFYGCRSDTVEQTLHLISKQLSRWHIFKKLLETHLSRRAFQSNFLSFISMFYISCLWLFVFCEAPCNFGLEIKSHHHYYQCWSYLLVISLIIILFCEFGEHLGLYRQRDGFLPEWDRQDLFVLCGGSLICILKFDLVISIITVFYRNKTVRKRLRKT